MKVYCSPCFCLPSIRTQPPSSLDPSNLTGDRCPLAPIRDSRERGTYGLQLPYLPSIRCLRSRAFRFVKVLGPLSKRYFVNPSVTVLIFFIGRRRSLPSFACVSSMRDHPPCTVTVPNSLCRHSGNWPRTCGFQWHPRRD